MRLANIALLFLCILFARQGSAGEVRVIELTDGSMITGHVLSLNNGVYLIRSDSLGIVNPGNRSTAGKNIERQGYPGSGQTLKNDPDFPKGPRIPEIMKAVKAGYIPALTANPKFMKLLDNAKVK